jgi:tRNA dimethylallyltransferase
VKVVFVVGTTASGKSDLALQTAEAVGGAVVNCDSIQVYQGLKIGSALPSNDEFKRVPHFLFSYVPEGKTISAGDYCREFFATLNAIKDKYPYVFVVGGTGFYFQAIEKGMFEEGPADSEMKARVEAELKADPEKVYQEMLVRDPSLEKKIFPNDHYRIGRAVELMRSHDKSLSEIRASFAAAAAFSAFPYPLLKTGIGILKDELLPRVVARTEKMLAGGLIEEVRGLMARNPADWKPLSSVGYAEVVSFLRGELGAVSERELFDLIVRNTMRLAKKQRTWFRRDGEISWFRPGDAAQYLSKIKNF